MPFFDSKVKQIYGHNEVGTWITMRTLFSVTILDSEGEVAFHLYAANTFLCIDDNVNQFTS